MLRGFQGGRDDFPRDPWQRFCIGYFEAYVFNYRSDVLLKIIEEPV